MSKIKLAKILFILGLLLIISSIGLAYYNIQDAARAEKEAVAAEEEMLSRLEEMTPSFFEFEAEEVIPDMATMEIDGELYIGTIEVPNLEVKLPVISDWDNKKLKKAPCKFSGSYYTDDLVLCGHNYRGGKHFSPLRNITENTDVYFTTADGQIIHYKVIRTEVLGPKQYDEMVTKTDWDMTLYTCTSSGSKRFTVRCVRV